MKLERIKRKEKRLFVTFLFLPLPFFWPRHSTVHHSSMTSAFPEIPDKKVWTTLITNTKYLTGLLTLNHSLQRVNSKYRLVALYTDRFPQEGLDALDSRSIPRIHIKYLLPTKSKDYTADPRFYDCWSKLQPFSLTQFERIVQLDSDMVVIRNMDELFDLDLKDNVFAASHACVCNPMSFEHYPKDWIPENCGFTDYYSHITEKERDGVEFGPQPEETKLKICNGGLQLVSPNESYYQAILNKLDDDSAESYEFADQSLLSDVFDKKWIGLSYIYNYLKTMTSVHKELEFEHVKNVHYILTPKPWDVEPSVKGGSDLFKWNNDEFDDTTGTFKYWWDINTERLEKEKSVECIDGF